MKRFNDKLYKELYKAFDKLSSPIKKIPVLKNYPERGLYFNLLNGRFGKSIEGVTSKKDFEEENFEIMKLSDASRKFYKFDKLEDLDAICIRVYNFSRSWSNIIYPFDLISAKILFKDKTIITMPEICEKLPPYSHYRYTCSNIFLNSKDERYINHDLTLFKDIQDAKKIKNEIAYIYFPSYIQDLENASKKSRIIGFNGETWEDYSKILTDFYGGSIKTIAAGRIVDISKSPKNLGKYLRYKEPKGIKSAKKNKYLAIELPEIAYDEKYGILSGFAQKVDDKISVLRVMKKDEENKKMEEMNKIFIEKNTTNAFRKNEAGEYVKMNLSSITNWDFDIYGVKDSSLDGTLFRFTEEIVESVKKMPYASALALVLGNPIIEQLYKSPLKDVVLKTISTNYFSCSYKNILEDYFGVIDYSKKSLNQKLGLNKYQLTKMATIDKERPKAFWRLKRFFSIIEDETRWYNPKVKHDCVDLSSIDNNTFDEICKYFEIPAAGHFYDYIPTFIARVNTIYDRSTAIKVLSLFVELPNSGVCLSDDYWHVIQDYSDFLSMVRTVSTRFDDAAKRFPPYFDINNFEDSIDSMHDLVMEIATTIKNEEYEKSFKAAVQKLDKWVYEDDKQFAAIAPSKMVELTEEGIKLHHCVGSYIQRVASGYTNIMFIRKKEDLSKPFYTVEITNDGSIQQIHGSCNCNVAKGSDLEKFVGNWIKQKKLKLTNYDKIR